MIGSGLGALILTLTGPVNPAGGLGLGLCAWQSVRTCIFAISPLSIPGCDGSSPSTGSSCFAILASASWRSRPLVVWPLYLSERELSRVGRGDDDDEARVRSVGGNEREERLDDYTTRTITPNAGSSARDDAVPAGGSRAHGRGDGSSPNQIRGTDTCKLNSPNRRGIPNPCPRERIDPRLL